jgi:Meiotically up-regulated gene 113
MTPEFTGYVYCIRLYRASFDYIKIGHTFDVKARLKTFRQIIPLYIELVAQFAGSRPDELAIHHMLAAQRVQGEWYYESDAVLEFIHTGDFFNRKGALVTLQRVPCMSAAKITTRPRNTRSVAREIY